MNERIEDIQIKRFLTMKATLNEIVAFEVTRLFSQNYRADDAYPLSRHGYDSEKLQAFLIGKKRKDEYSRSINRSKDASPTFCSIKKRNTTERANEKARR